MKLMLLEELSAASVIKVNSGIELADVWSISASRKIF